MVIRDVVVRWNADGSRDTSFGPQHTGVATVDFDLGPVGWRQDVASSVAVQPDGKVLVGGGAREAGLARFLGDAGGPGELETGFGNGGIASFTAVDFPTLWVMGMARDTSGKVVVMVQERNSPWHAGLLRLDGDQLDPGFGSGGWSNFVFQPPSSATTGSPMAVAVQADGKLLIAGTGQVNGTWNFVATRRTADGNAVDPTFSGGWSAIAFDVGGGLTDLATAIALAGGRIVVAGEAQTSTGWLFAAARLDNAVISQDGFESGSTWFWSAAR